MRRSGTVSPPWFITVLLDPKAFPPDTDVDLTDRKESAKYLKHIWERKFVKRVKRRSGVEVKYVAAVERHQSGQAHLHVVMSCTLSEDELRDQWVQSGGGVVMEAESVQKGRSLARRVGYVVKYIFQEAACGVSGNAVLVSEGIGYHSAAAKEKRREWAEKTGKTDPGRYVFEGPTTGGREPQGETLTEQDKMRFDRLEQQARSVQYIEWEDQEQRHLPRDGIRVIYDRTTGSTTRERVRKVRSRGGPKIVTVPPD